MEGSRHQQNHEAHDRHSVAFKFLAYRSPVSSKSPPSEGMQLVTPCQDWCLGHSKYLLFLISRRLALVSTFPQCPDSCSCHSSNNSQGDNSPTQFRAGAFAGDSDVPESPDPHSLFYRKEAARHIRSEHSGPAPFVVSKQGRLRVLFQFSLTSSSQLLKA